MRKVQHRITVGSGENTSIMDILEWGGRMQGTVPTMTVAAEVLSHGVSMIFAAPTFVLSTQSSIKVVLILHFTYGYLV